MGHVFESTRSSFTRPKDSSAKDELEGRPYSQRPTPSYSSTPMRPATPPPTPPRGEAAAQAAPPPAPVVGTYAAASSGSSSVDVSPGEHDLRSWDEKLETSESLSPRTLLHIALRWPMMRDPSRAGIPGARGARDRDHAVCLVDPVPTPVLRQFAGPGGVRDDPPRLDMHRP